MAGTYDTLHLGVVSVDELVWRTARKRQVIKHLIRPTI
jgi:hypothetical protein